VYVHATPAGDKRLSPDNSKKRPGKHLLGLSGYVFEKILEERHSMRVQNFHHENSFQDLFEWAWQPLIEVTTEVLHGKATVPAARGVDGADCRCRVIYLGRRTPAAEGNFS
jgi:hypothetical protein